MRSRLSCLAVVLCAMASRLPPAAAEPESDWLNRLSAFRCKHSIELDAPSVDPVLFAMIAACWRKQPRAEPHQGPYSLIALDAVRAELRVVRISAFSSGGIHYARDGRIIWFSALNRTLVGQEQRFLEAFSLEPQSLSERSLGRIELPFVIGFATITKGFDCHAVRVQGRRDDSETLPEHRFLVFGDGDPIGSARILSEVERVLFWEPRRRVFVVETAAAAELLGNAVRRAALDCSAQLLPLDDALAGRLASVESPDGRYLSATTGDLLSTGFAPGERRAILFRGTADTTLPPVKRCWDYDPGSCDTVFASGLGWSSSGEHFAVRQPGDTLGVYRTADLAVVHEQPLEPGNTFLFIDDHAAYVVTGRGRFRRDAWR